MLLAAATLTALPAANLECHHCSTQANYLRSEDFYGSLYRVTTERGNMDV
jgi:hypothetical protein